MKQVVVCGFMISCPIAGVVWQHIHYLRGLRKLGYEPIYIEDTARYPYNPRTFEMGEHVAPEVAQIAKELADRFGFRWAYRTRYSEPRQVFGDFTECQIADLFENSEATLNVCGAQELHEEILKSKCLVYIESDPGVEQIKLDKGDAGTLAYLQQHHFRFTFGENIGQPDCPLPKGGLEWHATRQPVDLEIWSPGGQRRTGSSKLQVTTIANWETKGKDIVWKGQVYYWSKTFEFLKFSDLPLGLRDERFRWELTTDMTHDPASEGLFQRQGWNLHKPHELSADYDSYVRYIQDSDVEWTVAKDQYVRLQTGWFSDRSACYLGAGRPVITQETSFSKFIPTGEGLFPFHSFEEVRDALEQIAKDYPRHSQKAYEIAEEYFSAEKVVGRMMDRIGV